MPDTKSKTRTFRFSVEEFAAIDQVALARGTTANLLVREFVRAGLGLPDLKSLIPEPPPKKKRFKRKITEATHRAVERVTMPTPEQVAKGKVKTSKMVALMAEPPASNVQVGPSAPKPGALLDRKSKWRV